MTRRKLALVVMFSVPVAAALMFQVLWLVVYLMGWANVLLAPRGLLCVLVGSVVPSTLIAVGELSRSRVG